jgi:hypothetical protein
MSEHSTAATGLSLGHAGLRGTVVIALSMASAFARAFDPAAAAGVAAAHEDAPAVGGAFTHAAYAQLILESQEWFRRITSGRSRVRVRFSMCQRPYAGATELIASIRRDRFLEVASAASDRGRRHPLMGSEIGGVYDRFRAVHDVIGHGVLGVGFDRDDEYAAWRWQERCHSPLARRALATELHGEHSVRWLTGELPDHKGVVLDESVVNASRSGRR